MRNFCTEITFQKAPAVSLHDSVTGQHSLSISILSEPNTAQGIKLLHYLKPASIHMNHSSHHGTVMEWK